MEMTEWRFRIYLKKKEWEGEMGKPAILEIFSDYI